MNAIDDMIVAGNMSRRGLICWATPQAASSARQLPAMMPKRWIERVIGMSPRKAWRARASSPPIHSVAAAICAAPAVIARA